MNARTRIFTALVIVLVSPSCLAATPVLDPHPIPAERRIQFMEMRRKGYVSFLHFPTQAASFVVEFLDLSSFPSTDGRKKVRWRPDPSVPATFSRSPFVKRLDTAHPEHKTCITQRLITRGHLAAAQNHPTHTASYLMPTNLVAQDLVMNIADWNRVEVLTRKVALNFRASIKVVTGVIFGHPQTFTDLPQVKVDAECEFDVPSHLYKILLVTLPNGSTYSSAFMLPNIPMISKRSLDSFVVPIDTIEELTELNFSALKKPQPICGNLFFCRDANAPNWQRRRYSALLKQYLPMLDPETAESVKNLILNEARNRREIHLISRQNLV